LFEEGYDYAYNLIGKKANALVYNNPKKVLTGETIYRLQVKEENIFKKLLQNILG